MNVHFFTVGWIATPFQFFNVKHYDNISTGTPLTRMRIAGGGGKNCESRPVARLIACCQRCDRLGVINTVPPDRGELVTLIAGSSKRRSLLMAIDDEVFMTTVTNVTPKKQNSI